MSNPLAVPTVSAALVTLIQGAVDTVGLTPGPRVSAGSLEDTGDNARVSVHLYRVSRDEHASNRDLPTRSAAGDLRSRPTVALNLHFLLCFRGDSDFDAQTMLAVAAVTLEANAHLSAQLLTLTEADHPEVAGHDLDEAPFPVRWGADSLSVDELTKMWALYPAGSFGLTLAVQAGPVLVEAAAVPTSGPPVQAFALGAYPMTALRLDSVGGPQGPGAQVRAETPMPDLTLRGAGFTAADDETVVVLIDGVEFTASDGGATHLTVSAPSLLPGAHRVQVRKWGPPIDSDLSGTPTTVISENRVVMVVPTLVDATASSTTITTDVRPALTSDERVRLLLDPVSGGPSVALVPTGLTGTAVSIVAFSAAEVASGPYRLTLEVNGVRSIPALDAAGHYIQQEVIL
ncbi:hypothetical protein GCM10027020_06140 [Nocardioides salsibiostraticola]